MSFIFEDFLSRIEELIRGLKRAKSEGPLKIVCYTPAIGNLSAPKASKKVQLVLEEVMKEKEKLDLEMVCLQDPVDSSYEGKLQKLEKEVEEFRESLKSSSCNSDKQWWEQDDIAGLINELMGESALFKFYLSYGIVLPDEYGPYEDCSFLKAYKEARELLTKLSQNACVYMKRIDNLPHFHIFFNKIRGILYVPVNVFPIYINESRWFDGEIDYNKIRNLKKGTTSPVQLLGFETTDKSLLLRFEEFFEFCRTCLK